MSAAITPGRIVSGREVEPLLSMTVDLLVIGTGPGGAMALREAARHGLRAVALEAGSLGSSIVPGRVSRGMSVQTNLDASLVTVRGSGVGGSGRLSAGVCRKAAAGRIQHWQEKFGLRLKSLPVDISESAKLLGARPLLPTELKGHNARILTGLKASGMAGGPIHVAGGADGAWAQHPAINDALDNGAIIICDARVDEIYGDGRTVKGARGRLLDPLRGQPIGEIEITARAIVMAASAPGSAALIMRSGLPTKSPLVGRGLHLAPTLPIFGRFAEPVDHQLAIPQGVECTDLLHAAGDDGAHGRVWIATTSLPPALAATLLPGRGREHADAMRAALEGICLLVSVDDEAEGRITTRGNAVDMEWAPAERDARAMKDGLRRAAELLFASGAEEVLVPFEPLLRITDVNALDEAFEARAIEPWSPRILAQYPSSTLRMSRDPRTGATDDTGRVHGLDNLHVADMSIFPTGVGVPPLLLSTALGRRVGRHVAGGLLG